MGVHHLNAIRAVAGATVVGVADPLITAATLDGLVPTNARITADVDELLQDVKPDVVHIVTPPGTHAELAQRAIEAGCHVYVEKPFTPTPPKPRRSCAWRQAGSGSCVPAISICSSALRSSRERPWGASGASSMPRATFPSGWCGVRSRPLDQANDILPHAVYPLAEQLRLGAGLDTAPIELKGVSVRPTGDVYALLRLGDCTGVLLVTLSGRPIEQYQHLVGTNGWMRADYVTGSVTTLPGPGTGPGVLFTPYRRGYQNADGGDARFHAPAHRPHLVPRAVGADRPVLHAIASDSAAPLSPQSILDTVGYLRVARRLSSRGGAPTRGRGARSHWPRRKSHCRCRRRMRRRCS